MTKILEDLVTKIRKKISFVTEAGEGETGGLGTIDFVVPGTLPTVYTQV